MSEISNDGQEEKIGISPGVGIYSIFRHIKYKAWFALAEYIDNSIDSYLKHKGALDNSYDGYKLIIDIEFNQQENDIKISDNAAGISANDLERALRMAVRPLDTSGLSEYGMGMKAASCWFSPKWSVETQALGDDVKRKIIFDVQQIVAKETVALSTNPKPSIQGAHFTNVHLTDVYSMPTASTIAKIKEHLTSIYRGFLRDDKIIITVNGRALKYKSPAVLNIHPFSNKSAAPIEWRKELDFTCAGGQQVTGFAAIYPTARTKEAGFALLRRGRVVEGSYDEPYRPAKVFGSPGGYPSQRIYGELNMDSFAASFTKDSVQWEDAHEDFMSCLKAALKSPGPDLLKQAIGMRANEEKSSSGGGSGGVDTNGVNGAKGGTPNPNSQKGKDNPNDQEPGIDSNGDDIEGNEPEGSSLNGSNSSHGSPNTLNPIGGNGSSQGPAAINPGGHNILPGPPPASLMRLLSASLNGVTWRLHIELSHNPAHTDWLTINNSYIPEGTQVSFNERLLGVRIALAHSFTKQYCGASGQIEPIIRLGAAFALARTVAKEGGATHSSLLLDYVNELLHKL